MLTPAQIRERLKLAKSIDEIDLLTDELVRQGLARPRKKYKPQMVNLWGKVRKKVSV
jgi:hypothetical protein